MLNLPYKPPQSYYDETKPVKEMSEHAILCELKRVQRDVMDLTRNVHDLTEQAIVQAYRRK